MHPRRRAPFIWSRPEDSIPLTFDKCRNPTARSGMLRPRLEIVSRAAVQTEVDRLAERLQRSVVVDDPRIAMIYSSTHYGDEDHVRVDAMLKRRAGSEAVGHLLAQGILQWTRPGIIPACEEIGLHARVCVPIRWQGELLGFLVVMDSDGSLTTAETAEIVASAETIKPHLAEEHRPSGRAEEQLVRDITQDIPAVRRRALADLAAAGRVHASAFVAAIVVTIRGPVDQAVEAHAALALREAVGLPAPPAASQRWSSVADGRGLVLLIGTSALTDTVVAAHAERLVAHANSLSAGRFSAVSGIGPTLEGLEFAHESAELGELAGQAASLGLAHETARWTDLGPLGPLLRIPADQVTRRALPAETQALLKADRDGTLLATLRAYLDSGGSAPTAATALRVHRTTLYYRLSRIEELLALDLSDGRTRLSLHVGITLLDLSLAQRATEVEESP